MTGLNYYSESLKREVVQVQSRQITKEEARRKYGIKGHSTILKWIRKFEDSDPHIKSYECSGEQGPDRKFEDELIQVRTAWRLLQIMD